MSAHTATTDGLVERMQKHRTPLIVGAVCIGLTAVLVRGCSPATAEQATPQVLSGPTTTTTSAPPPIDPLVNLGQLSPTAAALVGPDFSARRELARRAAEVMTQSAVDQCRLVIGATVGGSWELSTIFGPAHPVGVFAGCPFPPVPTSTTTAGGA